MQKWSLRRMEPVWLTFCFPAGLNCLSSFQGRWYDLTTITSANHSSMNIAICAAVKKPVSYQVSWLTLMRNLMAHLKISQLTARTFSGPLKKWAHKPGLLGECAIIEAIHK